MSFEEMLPHLREGKYVRRKQWHTPWARNFQQHMWYEPYNEETKILRFLFSHELNALDLEANDWEIYTRQGGGKEN